MGIPHILTKALAVSSANNIALSQSPGAGVIVLNGSTAAGAGVIINLAGDTLAGGSGYVPGTYLNVPLTGGTGSGARANIHVSSGGAVDAVSIAATNGNPTTPGTGTGYLAADALSATAANLGGTGSGFLLTLVAANLSTAVATLDTQRRVIITSGGNDTAITFTVNGTNDYGAAISDTFAGGSGATVAQSNLDFKTITSVTHTGSVASTITIGTNTTGATPWMGVNWHAQPFSVEMAGIVAAGQTVTWGWQYTHDDPNNLAPGVAFPRPFDHPILQLQATPGPFQNDAPTNEPMAAIRLIVTAGTGTVTGTWQEAGLSGQ